VPEDKQTLTMRNVGKDLVLHSIHQSAVSLSRRKCSAIYHKTCHLDKRMEILAQQTSEQHQKSGRATLRLNPQRHRLLAETRHDIPQMTGRDAFLCLFNVLLTLFLTLQI
jgi:hypothetical protein